MGVENILWLTIHFAFVCIGEAVLEEPSPPKLMIQPPNGEMVFKVQPSQDIKNPKPFILGCEAEGDPKPQYKWIKNGKEFNKNDYDNGRISQQPGQGTLNFSRPLDKDSGQYQCIASNKYGTALSNSVFVRSAVLLSFKEQDPVTMVAEEGLPFKLTCNPPPVGWPKPNVYWMHQVQDKVGTHETLKSFNSSRITVDPEGTLWFSNVTKADESSEFYYVCIAYSTFQSEYKIGNRVYLQVSSASHSSSPPENKQPLISQYLSNRNITTTLGATFKLWCIIGGTPIPEIKWGKLDSELPNDRIEYGEFGKTLKITDVEFSDEGTYICNATNGIGTPISNVFDVSVYAAPYFTVEPENVNVKKGDTVEFKCKAEGNPTPEVKWIHNGKPLEKAVANPRRKLIGDKVIIKNVTSSDTGNYGCNATNSFGYIYKDVYVNALERTQIKGSKQSYVTAGGPGPLFRDRTNIIVSLLVLSKTFGL